MGHGGLHEDHPAGSLYRETTIWYLEPSVLFPRRHFVNINIRQLANLAKIDITPEEETAFTESVSGIMQWIDKLQEVDVSGIVLTDLDGIQPDTNE